MPTTSFTINMSNLFNTISNSAMFPITRLANLPPAIPDRAGVFIVGGPGLYQQAVEATPQQFDTLWRAIAHGRALYSATDMPRVEVYEKVMPGIAVATIFGDRQAPTVALGRHGHE